MIYQTNKVRNHLYMISKSYKKYLRREKARIRREVLEVGEQEKLIKELYVGIEEKNVKSNPKSK